MNAKKIVPLVIALISAVLVLVVAMKFISNKSTISVVPKRPQVVVAKLPIGAGSVINEEELAMTDLAIDTPPENVFQSPGQLIGRVPNVPLMPGQIITAATLTVRGTQPGMPALMPMGMRAITLDINEITGVAGNILPGSHVDIMQTMRDDQTGESMTRIIAQDVKVAATGMPHAEGAGDGGGRSITVFVAPEQAELLELAAMTGRARMALRPSNDNIRIDPQPVTLTTLKGGKAGSKMDPLTRNLTVSAATMPSAPSTRPTQDPYWTVRLIRNGSESDVRFALPKEKTGDDVDVSTESMLKQAR